MSASPEVFEGHSADEYTWASGLQPPRDEAVREAIDALPPDQKAIIDGLFWEHATITTIAARLGVNRNTVRARLGRAKQRLAAILKEHDECSPATTSSVTAPPAGSRATTSSATTTPRSSKVSSNR